jgi:hypothetical protein
MSKTTNPIIREHNLETNEVIDREMTNEEFSDYQALLASVAASQAQTETNATAKAALLNKLGITAEEATLLLS